MSLPSDFKKQMLTILGEEYPAFELEMETEPPVSIRKNLAKTANLDLQMTEEVAWCPSAYYLSERPSFTLDPLFHGGAYYVQEASSMGILYALQHWISEDSPSLKILDLCAAPGGKSTLLRELGKEHLIVSNEVIRSRYHILQENITKWGNHNVIVTNHDVNDFAELRGIFDIVLIDAPCSGEGLFRKDKKARKEWSLNNVQLCSSRQKRILANTVDLLTEDGILLYSTCTYNEAENTSNSDWMVSEFGLESLSLEYPDRWGLTPLPTDQSLSYQFYPHKSKGEGFYFSGFRNSTSKTKSIKPPKKRSLAVLKKNEEELLEEFIQTENKVSYFLESDSIKVIDSQWLIACQIIKSLLPKSSAGASVGKIIKNKHVPDHALAMATDFRLSYPIINLDKKGALEYLKGRSVKHDSAKTGWHIIRHAGLNLGWVKVLPNRVNNYYPKHYRIRMEID